MSVAPRNVPRFLPTLTEVVHPPVQAAQAPESGAHTMPRADETAIAKSVRSQLDAEMETMFRDAVSTALLEQVDTIAARVRLDIESILRQAVADMVAHEMAMRRHNS